MYILVIIGLVSLGIVVYSIARIYFRRYLGPNSTDHVPIFIGTECSPCTTTVCVLGWGGSTRRQLRRLLEFYTKNHIATVSWINPMLDCFFGVDIRQVERVLDLLVAHPTPNIFIHVHSNNGALVWVHMLRLLQTEDRYRELLSSINGVMFDSAPHFDLSHSSRSTLKWAFVASLSCTSIVVNRPQYFHLGWSPLMIYYLFVRFFHRRYFSSDALMTVEQMQSILDTAPLLPQYYLYGSSDRLIPTRAIEQFMAAETARGNPVTSHCFDSGHVNHLRSHPDEYGQCVLDFIKEKQKQLSKQ